MTAIVKQRKPRPKPARSAHLLIGGRGLRRAAVALTVGKVSASYLVTEIPADFGRGFRVEKLADGTLYHVNLDGARRMCDCLGFLQHGRCKHSDGLAALVAAGRL